MYKKSIQKKDFYKSFFYHLGLKDKTIDITNITAIKDKTIQNIGSVQKNHKNNDQDSFKDHIQFIRSVKYQLTKKNKSNHKVIKKNAILTIQESILISKFKN